MYAPKPADERGGVPGTQWGVWNVTKDWWVTWDWAFDTIEEAQEWLKQYKTAQTFRGEPDNTWRYMVRPYPGKEETKR